jgi:hypothetical protein
MVQPAESLLSKDPTRSYRTHPAVRCRLLKSEMRSVLMMVTNILGKGSRRLYGRSIPEPPSASVFFQPASELWRSAASTYESPSGASARQFPG